MPPLKFFLKFFTLDIIIKEKDGGTMRDFDEFTKIAKKEYNREDYPYGYKRGRGYIARKTLKTMGIGAGAGALIGPMLPPYLLIPAPVKSALGAGIGGTTGFLVGKDDARDERDLSWASTASQKRLKGIQNKITHKAYNLDDQIHPMYFDAFDKTPQAKSIRKELGAKGMSKSEIENSGRYNAAFNDFVDNSYSSQDALFRRMTAINDKLQAEDDRTQKAYENARRQTILEGRNNRLNKHAELDELYYEKVAADAPDIESEKDIIPKLTQEVTYSPKEKTPPTPGGKVTPSKYVQRKNKARYQD